MAENISEYTNSIQDFTNSDAVYSLMKALMVEVDATRALVNELRAWAIALATKLNADAGVTDEDYDAVIAAPAVTKSLTA